MARVRRTAADPPATADSRLLHHRADAGAAGPRRRRPRRSSLLDRRHSPAPGTGRHRAPDFGAWRGRPGAAVDRPAR